MSSSAPVKTVKKAVKGVTKAASNIVKKVAKPVKKVVEETFDIVEDIAPVAAPIIAFAAPGLATAIGSQFGLSGTAARTLGGSLIGATGSAVGGQNPLIGGLLGGGAAYIGPKLTGGGGLLGGGGVPVAGAQYSVAPGSFQAALPGLGVQTASSMAPFTAVPGSFKAALPGLLAGGNALLSSSNILNAIRLGNALQGTRLSPIQQPQQVAQAAGQQTGALSGQANFDPTLSLLTGYGAV